MSAILGELFGTALLVLLGNAVVAGVVLNKSKSQNSGWVIITIGWGLAVMIAAYAVNGVSGAHLNPAVTLGLAAAGEFSWDLVGSYILMQMIGGIIGGCLVYLHYLPHWKITEDADAKLGVFCTAPAIRHPVCNLISEIIGTTVLVLGILTINAGANMGPVAVGLLIIGIGMALGGTTGYAINPARDLGPRIAHFFLPIPGKRDSDWGYAWIPVVGPVIGGFLAVALYKVFCVVPV